MTTISRRQFMGEVSALGSVAAISPHLIFNSQQKNQIFKPQRLVQGDTIGLITPASSIFEPKTIRQGVETMQSLGFKVKLGKHIKKQYGYLAGSDQERVDDLHRMFDDDDIKAIIALRGGYGTLRLLHLIDYDLIRKKPKILLGYSDITALHLAIHALTGLVTFHGPVAISSFSEYTQRYFWQTLTTGQPVGVLDHPQPEGKLYPTADFQTIHGGAARGQLIGGNLTLLTALLGTAYDMDWSGKILFIEEVGEEPYSIDRMLTQMQLAGKFDGLAGIVIDRCAKCSPSEYKPAFLNTLSVEEVFEDRLCHLKIPISFGFSLGHTADKPTLPLGIEVTLDADKQQLIFEEAAVV